MSKAEKFIREHTRNCSNEFEPQKAPPSVYNPWLTPDQALRAVEIAREEMTKRACDAYCKICGHYYHTTPTNICRHACDYYKDFEKAMKDE